MWRTIQNGITIGQLGSENGIIIEDEEYSDSCRITLERCKHYYAITCGIYGGMVHTAFCSEEKCKQMYSHMKRDLQSFIIDSDTTYEEEIAFYKKFTSTY